jgi:hypothetical protein
MKRWPMFLVLSLTFAALTVAATHTSAGEARTHDGFLLRLSAGGGVANTQIDSPLGEYDINGPAGDLNIAIGGMVAPNLAIHGTLWGWAASEPDVDFDVPLLGSGSTNLDGTVTLSAFGGGVTYYLMPANLYFSGSIGMGTLAVDGDNFEADSDAGLAFDLTLGKEWWVGDAWGLGLAGGFGYHSVPADEDVDENWSGTSFTLRFSATLN